MAQTQMGNLQDLALAFFEATGALAEIRDDGLVDVLMPEAHVDQLGTGVANGLLRLAFDQSVADAHPEAQFVALGSPLADRLIALAGEVGIAAHLYVNDLKWSAQRAIRLDQWRATFANARFVPTGVEIPFACHYVALNFRVSYVSDEKREEVRTIVVDSASLQQAAPGLLENTRLNPRREFYVSEVDRLPSRERLATVYERAVHLLERQVTDQVSHYRRRTARHLEVETLRIATFYDDTEAELRRRLDRAEDDRRRQTLEMKIEANRLEKARKLADVQAKHRLRVVLTPISGAIITQPKVRTSVKVENRYATTSLDVVFDPRTGALELPTCQVCHDPAPLAHLCANGHIACDKCIRACDFCKRRYCLACGMGTCAVCGRAVCKHSQVLCDVCGQTTCMECKGRCHANGKRGKVQEVETAERSGMPDEV